MEITINRYGISVSQSGPYLIHLVCNKCNTATVSKGAGSAYRVHTRCSVEFFSFKTVEVQELLTEFTPGVQWNSLVLTQ